MLFGVALNLVLCYFIPHAHWVAFCFGMISFAFIDHWLYNLSFEVIPVCQLASLHPSLLWGMLPLLGEKKGSGFKEQSHASSVKQLSCMANHSPSGRTETSSGSCTTLQPGTPSCPEPGAGKCCPPHTTLWYSRSRPSSPKHKTKLCNWQQTSGTADITATSPSSLPLTSHWWQPKGFQNGTTVMSWAGTGPVPFGYNMFLLHILGPCWRTASSLDTSCTASRLSICCKKGRGCLRGDGQEVSQSLLEPANSDPLEYWACESTGQISADNDLKMGYDRAKARLNAVVWHRMAKRQHWCPKFYNSR